MASAGIPSIQPLQDRFDRNYPMGVQNPLLETPERRISQESSTRSSVHSHSMLVSGRMSSRRMASKSRRLSPGSKKDGSEKGISSAGTVRDPQIARGAWLLL